VKTSSQFASSGKRVGVDISIALLKSHSDIIAGFGTPIVRGLAEL
jgi:hypothetical protein